MCEHSEALNVRSAFLQPFDIDVKIVYEKRIRLSLDFFAIQLGYRIAVHVNKSVFHEFTSFHIKNSIAKAIRRAIAARIGDTGALPAVLPSPEQIYQQALGNRASVKAEEIRTNYAKTNIALAKAGWYPTLSMSGGLVTDYYALLGTTGKGFGAQLRDNFSPYVGFTLNVPIFDRLETRNNVRMAKLQLESQRIQTENVKKDLYKEIQQAWFNALAAKEKYASSQVAEASAKEAFDLETALYEAGKSTSTAFNEEKNNYLQSAANLAQARCEFMYQVQLLQLLAGKE